MDRRSFLKMTAAAGLGVVAPFSGRAEAATAFEPYQGPLYFFFNAIGGWDTTYLCDPKGTPDLNRLYGVGDIRTAGNIRYAPFASNALFFDKYGPELLVINGLDMSSPNHTVGQRYIWTGKIDSTAYPAFGALVAGAKSPRAPLSFMSFGAYDITGDLVPLSRVQRKEQLLDLLDPGAIDGEAQRRYHSEFAAGRIQQALTARHQRMLAKETLPRRQQARSSLFTAQLSSDALTRVREALPAQMPQEIDVRGLRTKAAMAVAAMKAGVCVCANFAFPVFDTHANNDEKQASGLSVLLQDIDFALEAAEAAGIRQRITVVIGSDFGRTPKYNAANGKDHWSIGSAMLLGPGIRGNRVIGATDEKQNALHVDPVTLATVPPTEGVRLRPEHLHHALRIHAGVADTPGSKRYPLGYQPLPLFT